MQMAEDTYRPFASEMGLKLFDLEGKRIIECGDPGAICLNSASQRVSHTAAASVLL